MLASLARDYLAISGSSAAVERTFSAAADVCTSARGGLSSRTIERCVSSHMWLKQGIKASGNFTDCQSIVDHAESSSKFATWKS